MEISALVLIQRTVTGHNSNKHVHSRCVHTGIHSWNFPCIQKKKGPPQFKNSFSASVKYAALITSSSLIFKECHRGMWRDLMYTEEVKEKDSKLAGWQDSAQGYLLDLQLA